MAACHRRSIPRWRWRGASIGRAASQSKLIVVCGGNKIYIRRQAGDGNAAGDLRSFAPASGARGASSHNMVVVQSRKLRAVLIGAAILAQLHLFFAEQLHHHGDQLALSGGQGQVTAQQTQLQSSPKPDPICEACRICLRGAVQLASPIRLPSIDSVALEFPVAEASKFARLLPSRLSSRAPPLS